ncbi:MULTISPECIES: AAA-like domain-containing protein [Nostoc]|uniref:AAA-like domain-containing protein n=1 Tax=Nostoc paludosum FACHB-159 TaxID=2692908 RepID=A0ABR8K9T8_9NOSO|nr:MULTISPECIES: AAA-like domain-containing protein [Nostoc]MBD2679244.1 AAA-like domain-containing protein [Nostoc sp. FACHB-857]MBD2735626.1 AAA-like domain-containing protein [Nostoc paludosum FACHB-159]
MTEKTTFLKRLRGVIVSDSGWQRLQAAKQQAVFHNTIGQLDSLDVISQRTGLSYNTLIKVHRRETAVDRSTLEAYFKSFGLILQPSDYLREVVHTDPMEPTNLEPINFQGPLPLNSPFYVKRLSIEPQCDEAILKPGALIRIKAPWQMGKTSLIARILNRARETGLQTLLLSMRLADTSLFGNLDRLLYWYCAVITRDLGLPNRLKEEWDELFGANYNCTRYFEKYILANSDRPIVIAVDDVDILFQYPAIANDFFGLLRVWYEKGKYGDSSSHLWQKLRLVVAHSTEVYIPLNINQSPFSVGLSIKLPELTAEQVDELAQRHGLNWSSQQANQLIALVGGNPYLLQVALAQIKAHGITLEQLAQQAIAPEGIYSDHLQRQLRYLQQYPNLMMALTQVMTSSIPVELELVQAFKLQSMGLVKIHNQQVTPSCDLYRQYFGAILPQITMSTTG